MIDVRDNNLSTGEQKTPEVITITMILEDLDKGIDRTGIKTKYNLDSWEIKQMFDHPKLKGKKAKKIRRLSFNFVDDTVLPGQIDLEDAIETENQSMKDVMIDEMNGRKTMDAQDQIIEIEDQADDWSNERQY
tara:strand:- start:186 stop:584 length:399 start_codon:yes stop_codon:yes gene_type:complete